jgi:hypothetical protein
MTSPGSFSPPAKAEDGIPARVHAVSAVIGTAGWSIARQNAGAFPADGTALERYAHVFGGVEINSSFHRPHRAST